MELKAGRGETKNARLRHPPYKFINLYDLAPGFVYTIYFNLT